MEWAAENGKDDQASFANYYEKHRIAYASDEALGAHFSTAPNVITADMMRVMLETFEQGNRDDRKRWNK